jgi:ribonuclease R
LAFDAYTHFTSRIRRYPDLLVHRVIKAVLAKRKYQLPVLPTPGEAHVKLARRLEKGIASKVLAPGLKPKKMNAAGVAWQAAGLHCSANERRADEASRDVEAWLKCKYMREHLGEEYGGVVTAATSFGIFVTLDAMYVEGLVHITELGGEYFRFDEARQELRGERTGTRYAIGTRVRIQVSRVDLDGRKIDFRLVPDGDALIGRAMTDKGVQREAKSRPAAPERSESESYERPSFSKAKTRKNGVALVRPDATKANDKPVAAKKKSTRKRR